MNRAFGVTLLHPEPGSTLASDVISVSAADLTWELADRRSYELDVCLSERFSMAVCLTTAQNFYADGQKSSA
jgi:hypothetical protein